MRWPWYVIFIKLEENGNKKIVGWDQLRKLKGINSLMLTSFKDRVSIS